ncbi:unnamed protein product [Penicillium olsonii]|uniref:D-arabinono-1,4-lactone oxidase n=1 Tax=Penicillium olsonii TaxID=99116 RepID=A0A9W4HTX5_PENOL|nr:unnamed protein product [Penicillium olsonii]CAG8155585.1 unnamed protein product [Penicillium olsonii]CAG8211207.1 unnamed protein product [Penicillium olsonii]
MIWLRKSLPEALVSLLAATSGAEAYRWFNWQFDVTCESTGFHVPANESELVEFVRFHYPRKTMLKPVGNGHGFGNLTTCVNDGANERESYILSLTNLKHLEIHDDNTVTFGGGWDLVDLMPTLEENGLQVANLGSEKVQNYIGAATTGTHGTGKQHQNLATQIQGLRVLDAKGEIHEITKQNTPDLLKAYSIAIGALGIILEVTVRAEPLSYLKRTTKVVEGSSNITELYQQIAEFGTKYEQVNIVGPTLDYDQDKHELVVNPNMTLVIWEETDYKGARNCSIDYCSNDCGRCDRDYVCYDYKTEAIATTPSGICYRGFMGQFEHFLPIESLAEAGTDYMTYAKAQSDRMKPYIDDEIVGPGLKGHYQSDDVTVITRFVKGDDNWLSPVNTDNLQPNASGIFATLEYSWIPTYNNFTTQYFFQELASEYIPKFGEIYNVRPHWNKMLFHNETYTSTIYPKMNEWVDLQKKMDPNCQFVNDFLAESLGIDRCQYLFD